MEAAAGNPPSASGRRRRLLLVGDYPPPWGGIAVHVRALLDLGLREGFDAWVLDVGRGRAAGRGERVISAGGAATFLARLAGAAAAGALVHAHVSGNNAKAWLVAFAAGVVRRPGAPGPLLTVHSGLVPAFLGGGSVGGAGAPASGPGASMGVAGLPARASGAPARGSGTAGLSEPAGTSGAPPGVWMAPAGVSGAPAGVSGATTDVSMTPAGVSAAPAGVSAAPAGVSAVPAGVSAAPAGVSAAPADVSSDPLGDSGPPSGVSRPAAGTTWAPAVVSGMPVVVADPPAVVRRASGMPMGVSNAAAVVSEAPTGGAGPAAAALAAPAAVSGPPSGALTAGPLARGRRATRRWLVRAACSPYARVLCANPEIARALREAGVPAARLEVLPAFARGRTEPGVAPVAAIRARDRHVPLLVAALAPGAQYGEDVLFEGLALLAARSPGAGLVVFGPGTADPALLARAVACGLRDRVTALGEVDHPAALAAMRLGDLFVRPTRADGDSISVREALGLGVRVLASDVGQRPPGVVRFSVGDPASLAAGARAALAGPRPDDAGADVSARILELWRNPHAPMSLDEVKP